MGAPPFLSAFRKSSERVRPGTLLFLLIFLQSGEAGAELSVPALFGDHMVLQQGKGTRIWGRAAPGRKITVEWGGVLSTGWADPDGRWRVELPDLRPGGPGSVTISGDGTVVLKDVMIGEVWLGAGQSNMEFPLSRSLGGEEASARSRDPEVRFFTLDHRVALRPQEESKGSWEVLLPGALPRISALAFHFACDLHRSLGVPIGMVISAWGGTAAEAWTPLSTLAKERAFLPLIGPWRPGATRSSELPEDFPFQVSIRGLRWVPKDPGAVPVTVDLSGSPTQGRIGGSWIHFEKAAEKASLRTARRGFFFGREALTYSGILKEGGRGVCSTGLVPGQGTFDPGPFRALEFSHKGTGCFSIFWSLGLGVVRPFLDGEFFHPSFGWKVETIPVERLMEGAPQPPKDLVLNIRAPLLAEIPGGLYNGMVAPLVPLNLAGVLWYQGETNTTRAKDYTELLSSMIRSWREGFQRKDLPFAIVQLPEFRDPRSPPGKSLWAELRWAQDQAATRTGALLINTLGLGASGDIHPRDKEAFAHRATRAVLGTFYHFPGTFEGPSLMERVSQEGGAVLKFKGTEKGLRVRGGGRLRGFELAGADGIFHPALARIDGNKVLLRCKAVPRPQEVRYAWEDVPGGNLENGEGFPAFPFRASLEGSPR